MNERNADLPSPSNTGGTAIERHMLRLMHIHDSAFPIGSYTHSFGLETYIQHGSVSSGDELFEYVHSYVYHNLLTTDAIIVQEAYRSARQGQRQKLLNIEQICHGIKIAAESRAGSQKMGKQFLNTLGHVYDFELLTWWQEQVKQRQAHGHYAVIYGMSEALLETPLRMAVTAFMYSSACALVHNAVRAIPLGQQTGVKIIHELLPHIDAAGRAAVKLTLSDLANNALGIEMGSMEHEFLHSRLFLS